MTRVEPVAVRTRQRPIVGDAEQVAADVRQRRGIDAEQGRAASAPDRFDPPGAIARRTIDRRRRRRRPRRG